jgi:hypothetical protein
MAAKKGGGGGSGKPGGGKQSSDKTSSIASRALRGGSVTKGEVKSLAGSVLS